MELRLLSDPVTFALTNVQKQVLAQLIPHHASEIWNTGSHITLPSVDVAHSYPVVCKLDDAGHDVGLASVLEGVLMDRESYRADHVQGDVFDFHVRYSNSVHVWRLIRTANLTLADLYDEIALAFGMTGQRENKGFYCNLDNYQFIFVENPPANEDAFGIQADVRWVHLDDVFTQRMAPCTFQFRSIPTPNSGGHVYDVTLVKKEPRLGNNFDSVCVAGEGWPKGAYRFELSDLFPFPTNLKHHYMLGKALKLLDPLQFSPAQVSEAWDIAGVLSFPIDETPEWCAANSVKAVPSS